MESFFGGIGTTILLILAIGLYLCTPIGTLTNLAFLIYLKQDCGWSMVSVVGVGTLIFPIQLVLMLKFSRGR